VADRQSGKGAPPTSPGTRKKGVGFALQRDDPDETKEVDHLVTGTNLFPRELRCESEGSGFLEGMCSPFEAAHQKTSVTIRPMVLTR